MKGDTNYIVSGIERSGTSLIMQILEAGGLSVAYDNIRKADENNPKGYFELEDGKIINKLMNKEFPLEDYKGKFIKITAYGLTYLPKGKYEIIFMERHIEEILDSMEKMATSTFHRDGLRKAIIKLRNVVLDNLRKREDVKLIIISHSGLINKTVHPNDMDEIKRNYPELDLEKAKNVIDKNLYRNKR